MQGTDAWYSDNICLCKTAIKRGMHVSTCYWSGLKHNVYLQRVAMKSYSETRQDSWLWKAKALRVDVLARLEKLKKLAQISTKGRRKAFLFWRKSTRRLSTEDWRTLKDFAYMRRQLILTMVHMESETSYIVKEESNFPWLRTDSS